MTERELERAPSPQPVGPHPGPQPDHAQGLALVRAWAHAAARAATAAPANLLHLRRAVVVHHVRVIARQPNRHRLPAGSLTDNWPLL